MILNMNDALEACKKLKEIDKDIGKQYEEKLKKIPVGKLQPPTTEWKPQIGDWVVTDNLKSDIGGNYNGKLGQIWKIRDICDDWYRPIDEIYFKGGSLRLHNLRKATQQEIDSMSKTADVKPSEAKFEDMSKDELLEYAKKKYLIGCKFLNIYNECITVIGNKFIWLQNSLCLGRESNDSDANWTIYDLKTNKWAEIIEMPKSTPSQVINSMEVLAKEVLPESNRKDMTAYIGPPEFVTTGIMQQLPRDYYIRDTNQNISEKMRETLLKLAHQSINKRSKFSPIKVELIKIKKLKK